MNARHRRRPGVWLAGAGQTGPAAADSRSIPEMVLAAVEAALEDAALTFDDIDAVVTASVDLYDGLTASNLAVTEVVGAVMKPETRIAADGLCAALHGACQILAGAYETVLVVAHGKASMASFPELTTWAMDPVYLQPLGVDFETCAGLQAQALAAFDERAERRWAELAAERRRQAAGHGVAPPRTAEEVLASPIVASPVRREMVAPRADGACAMLLRQTPGGRGSPGGGQTGNRTRITGFGWDLAAHAPGDRDLEQWAGVGRACARAYQASGVVEPADSLHLLEPSCHYAHEEELFVRASGAGSGPCVSPTGGLFAGAIPVAAGLSRLIAADRWLRQRDEAGCALVHGSWGPIGQGQAVVILEAAA
ncbi:MAG: hypothetical protein GY719_33400 [bacterium]|nr:hypothetical protein [bacterium]